MSATGLFSPEILDFGVVKDKQKLPFTINNISEYPILGFSKSCGCLGNIEKTDFNLTGEITAEFKSNKTEDIFLIDGKYCQRIQQNGQEPKYLTFAEKVFIDNPEKIEKLSASKYQQTISVRLKDNQEAEKILPSGEITENTAHKKADIPVLAWVIK